eukprot:3578549-Prymnesium_polylepis.1
MMVAVGGAASPAVPVKEALQSVGLQGAVRSWEGGIVAPAPLYAADDIPAAATARTQTSAVNALTGTDGLAALRLAKLIAVVLAVVRLLGLPLA